MWVLSTFGGLSLKGEGAAPPSGVAAQRRPLALLALLAASGDLGLSRDKLLFYLWPENDQERARNALRQLLHTLRRGLGDADLLLGSADLRLNPNAITSDVGEFEAAFARRDFRRAAALYRGAFLDGFHLPAAPEFEYWVDTRHAEYAAHAASALEALAREAAQRRDLQAALDCWRRLAALDPLNSRIATELMNALASSGNPAGALQHARVHTALVREELGTAPDAAVAALEDRLRSATITTSATTQGVEAISSPADRDQPGAAVPALGALPGQLPRLRDRLQAALADRYDVEQELAQREGTTRVFLARDRKHDRPVALKLLHPALASSLDLQRFVREVALTARLHHPHIVPLLDSGEAGGQPWYAMPRLEGESLRERLVREGKLSVEAALEITLDVAEALDYAHRLGVIHRDIKPENVLLAEGHAFVTNFGVATALIAAAGPKLTGTGMLVGTPAYMSPEQTLAKPVEPRADVYSLACVLYEMLTGEPSYAGPTPQAIIAKRTGETVQLALGPRPEIPDPVAGALAGALRPLPEDRSTMAEFSRQLTRVLEGGPRGHSSSPPPERVQPPKPGPSQRSPHPLLWGVAAALGALALGSLLCAGR